MNRARSGRAASLSILLTMMVAACSTAGTPTAAVRPSTASSVAPTMTAGTSPTASATSPSTSLGATASPTAAASCAWATLTRLSEAQRIGQLFLVGLPGDELDAAARAAIDDHHLGSWWFTETTGVGVDGIRTVSDAIQARATGDATGGVGFFVAANQEGGRIQALTGPGFDPIPSAVEQGAWPIDTLRTRAERWGRQLRDAGVDLDFAPVADVVPAGTAPDNAPIGRLDRQYGSDPAAVADHVAAFIDGMAAAGVVTTAKHFPGLGRVAANTDFASGVVDTVTSADDPDLEPFRRAVDVGVPAVMLSLATYERMDPDHLAAFSWPIIGGVLEDSLGFDGIVMSDSLSAEAVSSMPVGTRAVAFLQDGGDLIVVNPVDAAVSMAEAIADHARDDAWFRDRIDNAVLRVLTAKDAAGLLPCDG